VIYPAGAGRTELLVPVEGVPRSRRSGLDTPPTAPTSA